MEDIKLVTIVYEVKSKQISHPIIIDRKGNN